MVIRPHTSEIVFNRSEAADYSRYTQQLHQLLQREYGRRWRGCRGGSPLLTCCCVAEYNDSLQRSNDLCLVGEYTEQEHQAPKKVCQFKRSVLQHCSGLGDSSFGYAEGKPCVIITMNRVCMFPP